MRTQRTPWEQQHYYTYIIVGTKVLYLLVVLLYILYACHSDHCCCKNICCRHWNRIGSVFELGKVSRQRSVTRSPPASCCKVSPHTFPLLKREKDAWYEYRYYSNSQLYIQYIQPVFSLPWENMPVSSQAAGTHLRLCVSCVRFACGHRRCRRCHRHSSYTRPWQRAPGRGFIGQPLLVPARSRHHPRLELENCGGTRIGPCCHGTLRSAC